MDFLSTEKAAPITASAPLLTPPSNCSCFKMEALWHGRPHWLIAVVRGSRMTGGYRLIAAHLFFGMKTHIGMDTDSVWRIPCAAWLDTSAM